MLNQSEPNLILTAHATKLNRPEVLNQTEPNRKRVWPVEITPLLFLSMVHEYAYFYEYIWKPVY